MGNRVENYKRKILLAYLFFFLILGLFFYAAGETLFVFTAHNHKYVPLIFLIFGTAALLAGVLFSIGLFFYLLKPPKKEENQHAIEIGRDFIASATHELKTPITILRGFAETLHENPHLPAETYRDITEKMVANCQRMDTLVKNLLTLAALDEELPSSRLKECDLADLAAQSQQAILSLHPEAKIAILNDQPWLAAVDPDLFFQALLNLLDNAVKYSKPPASVTISFSREKEGVVIKVADKGMGIPKEDLNRIFERFYAVNKSLSRSLGGSGLGLAIVKRIVEKHHGKISVESQLGKGSTFKITLPP
jgi:two-component system, OmpR family, phosphate regulon sensor histidine kinase PhoR